jgi:murein L,D-transpeptidase YcbB/YkuD
MKYYSPILLVLIFFGCKDKAGEKSSSIEISSIEQEAIFPKELMSQFHLFLDSTSQDSLLNNFYQLQEKFVWFNSSLELTEEANELISLLKNSKVYGLDSTHYSLSKLNQLIALENEIETEFLLTNNYVKFGKQISHGQIEVVSDYYKFERRRIDTNWCSILNKGINDNTIIEELLSLQPKNKEYVRLQKGVEGYLKRVSLSDSTVTVQNKTKDSVETYKTARKALVLHGVIKSDLISDSLLVEGVKKFQYEHGLTIDGLIGKETASELSKSTNDYYKQAKVALEKWRWTKDFEPEHIFVNIATYKMKCYSKNELTQEKKVVVGTNLTRTPELESKLDYMIAYPYWHVPRSIVEGELVAKAIKDSTYLSRNGYEVFKGANLVNSENIDWSNGNDFKFRQKGGGSNALGVIKFIFPNRHTVYFHDTPSKRFFEKGRRSFSHGCIRVNEPMGLAKYFLENDSLNKYSIDTVRSFIENKTRKVITLNKKTPIHIRYYTVEADTNNDIRFYPDVYFIEKELEEYPF